MSRQCPFPVRSTDSRSAYRTGSLPGLTFSLALIAALACFAGVGHAADPLPEPAGRSAPAAR